MSKLKIMCYLFMEMWFFSSINVESLKFDVFLLHVSYNAYVKVENDVLISHVM